MEKVTKTPATPITETKRKDSQTYALKQVADMAKKFKENDWITKEQFQHLKEIHHHLTQKFIGGNVFDE